MCDRISCPNEPRHEVPTMFGTNARLCTKCQYEWRTMAYNLHMNFLGLLEFEQRAFLGQSKDPEVVQTAPTDPPPPNPVRTQDEEYFRDIDTDPGTPSAKKDDDLDFASTGTDFIYC